MEKIIKSIFCCSGEDSNSNDYSSSNNTTNKSSNQTRSHQNQLSSKNSSQKSLKNHHSSNNHSKKNSSNHMADVHNSNNQNNKSHHHHNHSDSVNNNNNKTDINVYEATDSTLETNDDGQNVNSSVMVDSNGDKLEQDSSIDSAHHSDIEMNEDGESMDDDFFDLTRIQPGQAHASTGFLLETVEPRFQNRKCLVLDLDETLVHSSFKYLRQADFVIPVDIDNQLHNVYVIKRPGVDEFMKRVGELYEVVVFTASVSRYGDPLLNELDVHKSVHHRLFRDSCYNYQGNYIKNLSQIGRPLNEIIILDNSPASYIFHPQHAIPISSWFSDAHDNELLDIIPFLEDLAQDNVDDIGLVLDINL